VRFPWSWRWPAAALLIAASCPQLALSQTELTRKPTVKIAPAYPELARRMKLRGTVKIMVTVLPNGNLKDTKVMGGNPILVNAAMDALKKWRFEAAQEESSGTVEFNFEPPE
jgi:TonB family protein